MVSQNYQRLSIHKGYITNNSFHYIKKIISHFNIHIYHYTSDKRVNGLHPKPVTVMIFQIPQAVCDCYRFMPQYGSDQVYWAREFLLAELAVGRNQDLLDSCLKVDLGNWFCSVGMLDKSMMFIYTLLTLYHHALLISNTLYAA